MKKKGKVTIKVRDVMTRVIMRRCELKMETVRRTSRRKKKKKKTSWFFNDVVCMYVYVCVYVCVCVCVCMCACKAIEKKGKFTKKINNLYIQNFNYDSFSLT